MFTKKLKMETENANISTGNYFPNTWQLMKTIISRNVSNFNKGAQNSILIRKRFIQTGNGIQNWS